MERNTNTWRLPDLIKLSISRPIVRERVLGPRGALISTSTLNPPPTILTSLSFFPFVFQDSHGTEETNTVPVLDTYQDVRVLSGLQNETHTTVTFVRKWQTCDPEDYQLTVRKRYHFI